jgi:hypothetical protein
LHTEKNKQNIKNSDTSNDIKALYKQRCDENILKHLDTLIVVDGIYSHDVSLEENRL